MRELTAAQADDLYELITERNRRSLVLTSNRTAEEWLPMMADPLLAQSAVDRLTSACYELVIEGESRRRRQRPGLPGPAGKDTP